MIDNPTVSIICTVYNKAPWLAKVIEGFLKQETDFPIEILLVDDASTDQSASIIKEYAARYPHLIRAFYQEQNQGIAKTWVTICQQARGFYIARCDGDDFWLDPKKLQKQVELLQNSPDSRWSNTDFDIYDEKGQLVSAGGFANNHIPLADTFEKMLATRGFTMASTWLVERELMLEVNQELDLTTSDDTFNLQLDLFQRTNLAFLPESTVAYTINYGSDSRPKDFSKIEDRFNRLLETQKAYLDKYPQSNAHQMLNILLDRSNTYELALVNKEAGLARFGFEKVTIYFERKGSAFSQEDVLEFPLTKSEQIQFTIPEDCQRVRIDLSEQPSFYSQVRLMANQTGTILLPSFTNALVLGDAYLFPNADPQLVYSVADWFGQDFTLTYQTYETDDIHSDDYVAKCLSQEMLDLKRRLAELEGYRLLYHQREAKIAEQQTDLETITKLYHTVICSRRWIIPTKIINFLRRKK